jgi:hypothetical protein
MLEGFDPEQVEWDGDFVLDDQFRFVSVAKTINPGAQVPLGRSIWDAYGGEDAFRAPYETVLATGEPVGFRSYFDSVVVETYAEMSGRYLRVRYRVLATVDVSTLESLLATMKVATEELAKPFGSGLAPTPKRNQRRAANTAPLRVVEGHESA